jgi:chromosome segregation ATPase
MDQMEMMREWMAERFDSMTNEVRETQRLQRETNGRLRAAEVDIANFKPRLGTLEREMGEVRTELSEVGLDLREGISEIKDTVNAVAVTVASDARSVAKDKQEIGEKRQITMMDIYIVLGTIFSVVAILKFFGRLQ